MEASASHSKTSSNNRFLLSQSSQSLPSSPHCSSIFSEYQLMKEFVLFQKKEFLHVYLSPSYESPFEWFGVMFIHHGMYKGKILRFSLLINSSYPNCGIPKIIFDPIPYHPLVDSQTGQLNVATKFKKWNSTCNFIFEVIAFVKQAFEFNHLDDLKNIVNIDKFDYDSDDHLRKTIDEKMKNFNERVIEKKHDDKHYIDFSEPENSSLIDKVKHKLLTEKFSLDRSLDYLSTNGNLANASGDNNELHHNHNRNYCTTSISGLSWAKKIVYN